MTKFQVQILERNVYLIEVEAEDEEAAVDLAYAAFGNDWDDQPEDAGERVSFDGNPDSTDSVAELVTNLETGEKNFRD